MKEKNKHFVRRYVRLAGGEEEDKLVLLGKWFHGLLRTSTRSMSWMLWKMYAYSDRSNSGAHVVDCSDYPSKKQRYLTSFVYCREWGKFECWVLKGWNGAAWRLIPEYFTLLSIRYQFLVGYMPTFRFQSFEGDLKGTDYPDNGAENLFFLSPVRRGIS